MQIKQTFSKHFSRNLSQKFFILLCCCPSKQVNYTKNICWEWSLALANSCSQELGKCWLLQAKSNQAKPVLVPEMLLTAAHWAGSSASAPTLAPFNSSAEGIGITTVTTVSSRREAAHQSHNGGVYSPWDDALKLCSHPQASSFSALPELSGYSLPLCV